MKYIVFFTLSIVIAVGFNSCKLESTCSSQTETYVKELIMPDSAPINTEVSIGVKYILYTSCGKFNSFLTSSKSDTTSIRVIVDYTGCSCPDVLPDSIEYMSFTGRAEREYFFRAIGTDGKVFQDTLKIYIPSLN